MLSVWLEAQGHGSMARLARAAGVSHMTLWCHVRRGYALSFASAKKVHEATGGAVSIESLCEGDPELAKRYPRKKPRAIGDEATR